MYEDLCEDRPTKEDTVTATEAGLPEGKSAYFSHTKSSSASVPRTSPVLSDEVQVVNTDTNVDGATMVSLVPLTAQ